MKLWLAALGFGVVAYSMRDRSKSLHPGQNLVYGAGAPVSWGGLGGGVRLDTDMHTAEIAPRASPESYDLSFNL